MSYAHHPLAPSPLLLSSPSSSSSSSSSSSHATLKDTEHIPLYKKVVFSGLSGAIATTCIYPLAITKTKLQNESGTVHSTPLQMMRSIWRDGGAKGFYRGWPPNVLFVMPEKALKLTMNDLFKRRMKEAGIGVQAGSSELSMGAEMVAGGLAGTVQVVATNPMELLQIQGATMADRIKRGELKAAISYPRLVRDLGVSGLYTGVFSTLVRDIPFSMLYFSLYSQLKHELLHDATSHLAFKSFLAGAAAGTIAAAVSCPADVIKTRVHAAAVPVRVGLSEFVTREWTMWWHHASGIVRQEGVGALFRGVIPRCVIISPLFGITMTCYEEMQQMWG